MSLSLVQEPPSSVSSAFTQTSPSFTATSPQARYIPLSERKIIFLRTRKARLQDAQSIHQLIDSFSHDGTLLRRTYAEICANIRTFTIVETHTHQFLGCAALHVYGQHLAEIRSIVVRPDIKGCGAGRQLVQALLHQANVSGIRCVCLFTRLPDFFEHFNFRLAEHQALRDKVLKDCVHCARRNACDETAMAIGELPSPQDLPDNGFFAPQNQSDLVRLQL